MDYIHEKENEIKNEINNMTIEELIYLNLNSNYFVFNKLKSQIDEIKAQNKQVQLKQQQLKNIKDNITSEDMNKALILKDQIENINSNIKQLIEEKNKLNFKMPKKDFIPLLENELKKFESPESCYGRFKDGIINLEEFEKEFKVLGKEKNYYYYKLIADRIKND